MSEAGSAPISLVLGLGLLVIPVLLLVLTIPTWEDRMVLARDAAAAAARSLATSDSWSTGIAAADEAVGRITAGELSPSQVEVTYAGSLSRSDSVSATVTVLIPAGRVPGIGSFGAVHYSATTVERIDDYRSLG